MSTQTGSKGIPRSVGYTDLGQANGALSKEEPVWGCAVAGFNRTLKPDIEIFFPERA